jgi:putative membrane protein
MVDYIQLAIGTVSMRPYVFVFFTAYLFAAVPHLGWKKVVVFSLAGYLTAFASEASSINTGIPYGWYYYIDATKDRELWIAGVPFFDSLSYVFLCYCSYATALFILSPLKAAGKKLHLLETLAIRRSLPALLLGSLLQVYLDIIIDPVALQGDKWFLGRIYGYRETGVHFGVPISNYIGWWFISAVMIFLLQRIAVSGGVKETRPAGVCFFPWRGILPVLLYISVISFNIAIAFLIEERTIATTGLFIVTLPTVMVLTLAIRRVNRYSRDELAEHLRDFPWSKAGDRQ